MYDGRWGKIKNEDIGGGNEREERKKGENGVKGHKIAFFWIVTS